MVSPTYWTVPSAVVSNRMFILYARLLMIQSMGVGPRWLPSNPMKRSTIFRTNLK